MVILAEFKKDNESIALVPVNPKEFKTGSRGFYANTKIEIDGKRYQLQIQMVEIGSKPKGEE
jgi:hypothetical protein